ncbi:hypothetical protein H0H93_000640 [Arthromyces matolae]|nr:hypothetical protein H0H93_000640 [Arthromyces matolae]
MKPTFYPIGVIACISGTPMPASVLIDRDGPRSLVLARQLASDNVPLPRYPPESLAATELDPPPTSLLVPRGLSIENIRGIGKIVEERVDTVIYSEPGAWRDPDDVEQFLVTTLGMYRILVDVESKMDPIRPGDPESSRLPAQLVNIGNTVFSALDVGIMILCKALNNRDKAGIAEVNGTNLIRLVTKLARRAIDHPQSCNWNSGLGAVYEEKVRQCQET